MKAEVPMLTAIQLEILRDLGQDLANWMDVMIPTMKANGFKCELGDKALKAWKEGLEEVPDIERYVSVDRLMELVSERSFSDGPRNHDSDKQWWERRLRENRLRDS